MDSAGICSAHVAGRKQFDALETGATQTGGASSYHPVLQSKHTCGITHTAREASDASYIRKGQALSPEAWPIAFLAARECHNKGR